MNLRADEVIEIIRVAAGIGVRRLKLGELEVIYARKPPAILDEEAPEESSPSQDQRPAPRQTRQVSPTEQELAAARQRLASIKASEEVGKVEEQSEARGLYMADLMINNPEAYERVMNEETHEHIEEG